MAAPEIVTSSRRERSWSLWVGADISIPALHVPSTIFTSYRVLTADYHRILQGPS
jgi:hypothetical protein